MATLADIGEREGIAIVQKILGRRAREAQRLDDAAVVHFPGAQGLEVVSTTDTLSASTHRLPGTPLRLFGYFACAVSISDLAAMGAKPRGMLLALGLPRETAVGDLEDLALGFRSACNRLGFEVWGGDLKEAQAPYITGTAVGTVPRGRALRRSRGVRPGWRVAVTGFLGRAAMGAILAGKGDAMGFELLYNFEPRVAQGLAASALPGRAACIDSSDGLAASLLQLARANGGIGFELDAGSLPLQPGLRKLAGADRGLELALAWGGDYELVFCAPGRTLEALRGATRGLGAPVTVIGKAVEDEGLWLARGPARERLEARGYEHFRPAPVTLP